jgi:hypothetical protein
LKNLILIFMETKINLRGIKEILSAKELRNTVGGSGTGSGPGTGSCGWRTTIGNTIWYDCGVSKAEAQKKANAGTDGYWCCDSCNTSTYCDWYFT